MKKVEIPTLDAYSVAPRHYNWLVPCPFCGRIHLHGPMEGHRVAHCGGHPNEPRSGYYIRLAGQAPDDMIKRAVGRCWRGYKKGIASWLKKQATA